MLFYHDVQNHQHIDLRANRNDILGHDIAHQDRFEPTAGCIDQAGGSLPYDQRGAARVAGARCDVGAFEYGAVVDRIFRNGFE